MNVLSLFSGVGGFDLGLERAGMRTIYQCEWDKHATSILNRHWPDVPKWGDISTLTAVEILRHGQMPDVVAWGSPCQDLSLAGKRAGLSGERSGLFHEGIRIIKELRKETNNAFPRFSIWENVAGALSSNGGADFGEVLDEMAEAGALVIEWAVLDAQHFGVPQRRRRVFVVAVFDPAAASRCPEPLLPVSESLRGDTEKGRAKGEAVAGSFGQSLASGRDIANTIPAELYHKSTVVNQDVNNNHLVVSNTTPCVLSFDTQFGSNANVFEDHTPPVKASQQSPSVQIDMAVRRLTPTECERLMGWPDDWTAGQADSHRYKQCGNGVASPVAQWIAQHILKMKEAA